MRKGLHCNPFCLSIQQMKHRLTLTCNLQLFCTCFFGVLLTEEEKAQAATTLGSGEKVRHEALANLCSHRACHDPAGEYGVAEG